MRPSEIPSWSAWMIARVKLEISGVSTRSAIFFSASWPPSPMRISPSARLNSSVSAPSMCSASFEIAPSNPRPASTLTASRSSASGSSDRTVSRRARAFAESTKSGMTKPTNAPPTVRKRPIAGPEGRPTRAPKTSPPIASAPLAARKAFTDTRSVIPAARSFSRTESTVAFGFSFSTQPASESAAGLRTRSLNCGRCATAARRKRPYVAARWSESERWREENVAYSATKKAAPASSANPRKRSIRLPLEGDDLLEQGRADQHHHEGEHDQLVARGGVVERAHVVRVDESQHPGHEEGQAAQDVGRHAAHRGQRLDLARDLLPVPDRLGDHVEEAREAAADLALDGDGGDNELEILRADAFRHLVERLVHRAAEAGLGEHALELLRRRALALLDDVLDPLPEAVAGLERRGDGDQEVGQRVLDLPEAPGCLEPDEPERQGGTEDEREEDEDRLRPRDGGEEADEQARAHRDVEELDRPERQVGALEQALHRAPVAQVAEGLLCRAEERRERGEALALHRCALRRLALRVDDVRGDPAADPGALVRGERETRREE